MEDTETTQYLIKKNFWQIKSIRTNFDRNGNVASVYLLLSNEKIHKYTKTIYYHIWDFVAIFGQPVEFSEAGLSAACVGQWIQVFETMELLDEEPVQMK